MRTKNMIQINTSVLSSMSPENIKSILQQFIPKNNKILKDELFLTSTGVAIFFIEVLVKHA